MHTKRHIQGGTYAGSDIHMKVIYTERYTQRDVQSEINTYRGDIYMGGYTHGGIYARSTSASCTVITMSQSNHLIFPTIEWPLG